MTVQSGGKLELGDAAKINVTNLSATEKGSFSVTGYSKQLAPNGSIDVNLLENEDTLINSGKTDLDVTILAAG